MDYNSLDNTGQVIVVLLVTIFTPIVIMHVLAAMMAGG
jgi:hypothetical protein